MLNIGRKMEEIIIGNIDNEQVITAIVLLFLGIEAMVDYKKRTVSLWFCMGALLVALAFNLVSGRMGIAQMSAGCVTGALILLMSFISKQKIGCGDGVVLAVIGMWLGGFVSFMTLVIGSTAAAAVLSVLLITGRVKKGQQTAFVPFLLAGFVGVIAFV